MHQQSLGVRMTSLYAEVSTVNYNGEFLDADGIISVRKVYEYSSLLHRSITGDPLIFLNQVRILAGTRKLRPVAPLTQSKLSSERRSPTSLTSSVILMTSLGTAPRTS